jgi:hypothetical protein
MRMSVARFGPLHRGEFGPGSAMLSKKTNLESVRHFSPERGIEERDACAWRAAKSLPCHAPRTRATPGR